MSFQCCLNKVVYFLIFLPILSESWVIRAAQAMPEPTEVVSKLARQYALVHDRRNFKEKKKGGKGFGPQGRVMADSTTSMVIHNDLLAPAASLKTAQCPWRYVVAVSCKHEEGVVCKLIKNLIENLVPQQERNRLAIILNINEKIVGFDEKVRNNKFDIKNIVSDQEQKEIAAYEVPVLLLYTPWTSFREDKNQTNLTPEQIRTNIYQELDALKKQSQRQYDTAFKELDEKDKEHRFPFGAMRTHMVNCEASKKFLAALHNDDVGLYLHIQDADFTNLKTKPQFYNFGQQTVVRDDQEFLFKRYDALIDHQITTRHCMPVLVGGAYVYEPQEVLKDASLDSKYWSRFAIEMSNLLKHLVGQYAPHGLYFHEPNTCVLLYAPKLLKVAGGEKLTGLLEKGAIAFGIDSEVQEFTRKVFKSCDDQIRRDAMIFSAQVVLATSMKGEKRGFNIRCSGAYNQGNKTFTLQQADDSICAIHGMPQGTVDANAWMNMIATSCAPHRKKDSRTLLSELFNLFDPYALSNGSEKKPAVFTLDQLTTTLRGYDEILEKEQKSISEKSAELQARYDKKGFGKKTAYSMVALAWECGQAMRLMFLDHLVLPGVWVAPTRVADIRKLLSLRLDHTRYDSGFPTQSYFVGDLLGLNNPAPNIQQKTIWDVVAELYKEYSQRGVAEVLDSSQATIRKLLAKQNAPQAIPTLYSWLYQALRERKSSDAARTFVQVSYLNKPVTA